MGCGGGEQGSLKQYSRKIQYHKIDWIKYHTRRDSMTLKKHKQKVLKRKWRGSLSIYMYSIVKEFDLKESWLLALIIFNQLHWKNKLTQCSQMAKFFWNILKCVEMFLAEIFPMNLALFANFPKNHAGVKVTKISRQLTKSFHRGLYVCL